MTREQLIQAMSLLNFILDTDYSIDQDYTSINMLLEAEKPLEANLQIALDNYIYQQGLLDRIQALGDIALLIDIYFQQNSSIIYSGDSWNPAGFDANKIESNFGWIFQELPKPTIDQLETIKAAM